MLGHISPGVIYSLARWLAVLSLPLSPSSLYAHFLSRSGSPSLAVLSSVCFLPPRRNAASLALLSHRAGASVCNTIAILSLLCLAGTLLHAALTMLTLLSELKRS